MKVVAILGGLGSQMFKYAFYLQIKNGDDCYIDTTPFHLQEMWNGYELARIFNIHEPDISGLLTQEEIEELKENGYNCKKIAEKAFSKLHSSKYIVSLYRGCLYPQDNNRIFSALAAIYNRKKLVKQSKGDFHDTYPLIYKTKLLDIYYDEFNHVSNQYLGGERKREYLRNVFKFPKLLDDKNIRISQRMEGTESIAMHVRRSDHMYDNASLYDSGYFTKAVDYVKTNTTSPVFYLFSDEPQWCKENWQKLGLDEEDNVVIVDWNRDGESFRDMQLMTFCQHNILAISSFSWWGYYLSRREEKVVCAPEGYWLEVGKHF